MTAIQHSKAWRQLVSSLQIFLDRSSTFFTGLHHTTEGKCVVHSLKNHTKLENARTEYYFSHFDSGSKQQLEKNMAVILHFLDGCANMTSTGHSWRRCSRYFIKGEKKGEIDKFVENLPGYPDNIKYDGEGQYWIGLSGGRSKLWDLILKYPLLRKFLMILSKLVSLPPPKEGGVVSVNLEGRLKALYSDRDLPSVTCGLKVGKHLYLGSISKGYILRIDLLKFEADK
ncbi:hypothetical protein KFK09_027502 [Dendrobium nobile]|uniref:Strictosidine synthase conserved region domain-containing protein n=1 Tax=Dendrobium nobile TaxID=94219 RepID=A0A8T3A9I0_DENNO|nr:hypothetical protein KFK09_027502 [Dendrobium nobile]